VFGLKDNVPLRVPAGEHGLTRARISSAALRVCDTLKAHQFAGCIVGGGVRDLLLGFTPKDFDIATDARPEQIKPLFRRAFVIGRRFRLVHVMIGQETVEVSTYRAAHPEVPTDVQQAGIDETGRLLRDNVFGNQGGCAPPGPRSTRSSMTRRARS
jgi:poly(A) polymerase